METKDPRMQWFCKEVQTLLRGITDQSFLQCLEDPKTVERLNMVCNSAGEKDNVVVFIAQEGDVFEMQGDILVEDSDEEWEEKEVSDDDDEGKKKTIKVKKDKSKKFQKVFHQRLHVTMSYIPDAINHAGVLRCAFFVKHTPEPIASADMIGMIPREDSMMRLGFEYAVLDNPSLQTMQTIMTSVFIPLLEDVPPVVIAAVDPTKLAAMTNADGEAVVEEIHQEIIQNAKELTPGGIIQAEVVQSITRLDHALSAIINHVGAERKLRVPDIKLGDNDTDVRAAAENDDLVGEIEEAVARWQVDINLVLDQETQRELSSAGRTPLGEIEYWKEKYNVLSGIYEQLNLGIVKTMLKVLATAQNPTHITFTHVMLTLTRQHNEAKDNVKFLNTLDRHFRALHNVIPGQSLQPISDTLASMMTAIRMVWIISRFFNTDDKMTALLEKVANEIARKVSLHVNIKTLLREEPEEAKRKLKEGQQVLMKWKSTYNAVREEINASEREQHWDFETKKLFDVTEHMALRCQELLEIVSIIEYYNTVLGSQLRQVLKDSTGIDTIMKDVVKLRKPIETVSFDPFDKKVGHSWEILHDGFKRNVEKLDGDVRMFIERIFDEDLRSSEAAFELLLSFKDMQARGGENGLDFKKLLMTKSDRILVQYYNELESVSKIFADNKAAPPLTKNQPPIAGAIHWSGSLFTRIKKPIVRFQQEDILHSVKGKQIRASYIVIAKDMKDYSTKMYDDWRKDVKENTNAYLKEFILARGPKGEYLVNFNPKLFQIIQEAKYLDRLGFDVPDVALTVTLQDEKFHNFVENLKSMLAYYNTEMAMIDPPERSILRQRIENLEKFLEPGFSTLNWNSLSVQEYITKCNNCVREFRQVSREVRKDSHHIQTQVVNRIASCNLVLDPRTLAQGSELLDIQDLADALERYKSTQIDTCVRAYGNASQLLRSIETHVNGSQSGKSKYLNGEAYKDETGGYYHHWEKRIFKALLKMVLMSISALMQYLNLPQSKHIKLKKRPPLFRIVANLSGQEVVNTPPSQEVNACFHKIMNGIIETTKNFVRWMAGSCLDVNPDFIYPKLTDEGQEHPFTFYTDIYNNSAVAKLKTLLYRGIQSPLSQIVRNSWKNMSGLWQSEKPVAVEKLGQRNLCWVEYDKRFHEYYKIMQSIDNYPQTKDFDFLCVDQAPLLRDLIQHAKEWINLEGKQLHDMYKIKSLKLDQRMEKYSEEMHKKCESIDDLKYVLTKIEEVRVQSLSIELQYNEIEYVYDSLKRYEVKVVLQEDRDLAYGLRRKWEDMLVEAKVLDDGLAATKMQFRAVTVKEVLTFRGELEKSVKVFREKGPGRPDIDLDKGCVLKDEWLEDLEEKTLKKNRLVVAESLFGLEITSYPDLVQLEVEIKKVKAIYDVYEDWRKILNGWNKQQWLDIQVDAMTKEAQDYLKILTKFKDDKRVDPHTDVKRAIENFSKTLPLFKDLKSDAMQKRHWYQLSQATKKTIDFENFTFHNLVEMELFKFETDVQQICYTAGREMKIDQEITMIKETWASTNFELSPYSRGAINRGSVLRDTSTIQETVDENIMNLQSISGVKWVAFFIDDVKLWMKRLTLITDVISVWILVQVKWQYLETIFIGSEDIAAQLPKETKKFADLDMRWGKIMVETVERPNVDTACHAADRLSELKFMAEKLDECQRELSNYLENKRCMFPRFYFISDDELLSILASSSPKAVQEHMLKMFDNCANLLFKPDSDLIEGVTSSEKERLDFDNVVNAESIPVEKWLNNIILEMRRTLRAMLKASVFHYPKMDRLEWVKKYHGMLDLAGSQIWWTWQVEDAFNKVQKFGKKTAVKELAVKLSGQLDDLVGEMDKELPNLYRKKVNTLVIVDVHARDICDRFVRDSVMDPREFEWESQLRFYWDKVQDTCLIRQCTGTFEFGYEYMGLNGRLVITPLTDRCFMTLTQALTFSLGGAPGGPAGTGKTESVKDLAKSFAYLCVVFNCGEGLDYKAMQTIFSGLAQSGAWGCFDEFNRIELPVLSVVSEQLRCIQAALRPGLKKFHFVDKEIQLDNKVGIFITMNPGYAGRVELPDNLKALFRPVVMSLPDLELICEIMLFSEGFKTARHLAKKMVALYSLSKGQLSKQHHYDWGLRALKSVLVMAGQLKRGASTITEEAVLMRALRDMNSPKFIADDEPLFRGLLGDLFPGLDATRVPQENLARAATTVLKEKKLQPDTRQIDKVVQLYETMQTRHTSMVVGPTGGGKSTIIQTLQGSQEELKLPTKLFIINPKAQTVSSLYGFMEPMSRSWTDGMFSFIFRQMNKPNTKEGGERERRYVVFDGDVDALWVENMNSVMDDNKLLTLPNGERIRLISACALLFEVGDLQYASPATVSRVGMVFVDQTNLGWKPFMLTWCGRRNKEEQETIRDLFDRYIQRLIDFVLDGVDDEVVSPAPRLVVPTSDLNMLRQLCLLMQCIIPERGEAREPKTLESVFIFCCVWSFGAWICSEEDRIRFDAFLKKLSGWPVQDNMPDMSRHVSGGSLPQTKTMYEYFFDLVDGKWKPWSCLVSQFEPPKDGKFTSILVPTVDTVRNSWLLEKVIGNKTPALFVGGSGTAKTVTIQRFLYGLKSRAKNKDSEEVQLEDLVLEINFSSRTTGLDVQRTLEDNVEKRTNTVLGAPSGKRLLVFVDDVNMPTTDKYGTQQPIAFLKLLVEYRAWYDRKDLLWKQIKDLQFLAAMAPPGGGRNTLDPRFMSLYSVFNIMFPSQESLERIYEQILKSHLAPFDESMQGLAMQITNLTLGLYKEIVDSLPATPTKFHYIFNLRDLSRIYEGLCRSTPEKFTTPMTIIRLWRNETLRVFSDRMLDENDKAFVIDKVSRIIDSNFKSDSEYIQSNPLLFGHFKNYNPEDMTVVQIYEDMGSYTEVRECVDVVLDDFNTPVVKMDLVMFDVALEHLLRIVRVISLGRGNCLLIGVGGSGKQSLTRIAAHACNMGVFEITLSRGYNEDAFREDLKKLYVRCGVEKEKLVFLFTDGHVAQEGFLELLNNMLASGMVPALFAEEEKEPLFSAVVDELTARDLAPTKDNKWSLFVSRCRDNLHIILSMSPSGETLRTRCRNFPGLINNTTIDWFTKWPHQALHAVATRMLQNETLPEDLREKIVDHIVEAHMWADKECLRFLAQLRRYNYVTPKNFLDYINNYSRFLTQHRNRVDDVVLKLGTGLEKLQTASADVAVMSKELAIKEIDLAAKSKANEEMLAETTANIIQGTAKQKDAVQTEDELNQRNIVIARESAEAEVVLAEAVPELQASEAALDNIKKGDIDEVKSIAKPTDKVLAVMKMICVLKSTTNEKPSWDLAKKYLQSITFLMELKTFNKSTLNDKKMKQVEEIRQDAGDPTYETLAGASKAAAGLFVWVNSMCKYYVVFKKVEPKKIKVIALEQEKANMEKRLKMIKEEIEYLNENAARLKERLDAGMAEAKALSDETALMQKRLDAAQRLLGGFTSERGRWQEELGQLKESRVRLVGDCLVAAAFLSYAGPFTYGFRDRIVKELWVPDVQAKEIPLTFPYKLDRMLTSDVEMAQWASNTLPTDELSTQNGMLTTSGATSSTRERKAGKQRFPLCVDPQMQAVKWIKATYGKNSRFEVVSFSNPDFLKRLEFSIQYGNAILFENVDEFIDPIIDPVLDQNFKEEGGRRCIKLGDKEVDWDENFRLFLCTKLANPNYTPEIFGKTNVINYGVTLDGLESQLLNVVVACERGDLQKMSEELVHTISENKTALMALEQSLIRELTLAKGNILDNDELIETLENTKASAQEVAERLKLAAENSKGIEISRQEYRPAAKRGAILFFVMGSLGAINPMYEYSLGAFLQDVFKHSMDKSTTAFDIADRLRNIMEYLTKCVYRYVCMGIFEKHKLMFAFQMALKLLEGEGNINHEETDFFLRGCILAGKDFPPKPDTCTFLSERQWNDVVKLGQTSEPFKGIVDEVTGNMEAWSVWYNLERPENEKAEIPCGFRTRTNALQQLCLLRCFRPDRVYIAATQFISACELMGKEFTTPPILRYADVYTQSNCLSPIICVVSPGANPTEEIVRMAEKLDMGGKLKSTSLGQGQGDDAMRNVEQGSVRGWWVLLQNCHLLIKWMKDLEKLLEKRDSNNKPHADFRLWLTTEPSNDFPISILQRSLKVVNEPPNGLKLNMKNTMSKVTEEQLEKCTHPAFRPLVYALGFFHAVVQERRKYGKIGWNVTYDFNETDFTISMMLIDTYLVKAFVAGDPIPWTTIRYLVGEAMYGGRVTDFQDRRVVGTYLEEYFGDFLFDTFQPFHFYHSKEVNYSLPPNSNDLTKAVHRDLMVSHIEEMPMENSPEVFGLHPNAETGYLRNATAFMWEGLIELMPRKLATAGGETREDMITRCAAEILELVPVPFDRKVILRQEREKSRANGYDGSLQPIQVVLIQELDRWNLLVSTMVRTLKDLQKAVAGIIGMSADLDELASSLQNGQLPAPWRKLAPATRKNLGRWLVHFQRRYAQFTSWIETGEPVCMWLSGLMVPDSFISALVQITCRKYTWPLDKSSIFTRVTTFTSPDDVKEPPKDGVYVSGLFLEGAKWSMSEMALTHQDPKVLIYELPVLEIIPMETSRIKLVNTFRTPVYVTSDRRNPAGVGLVFEADLGSKLHASHWILESVALVLNSDD